MRELWIPSQHHGTSRGAYLKGAYHTTEGAQKIRDLGAWFQNPAAGCSSHHGSDNFERGLFGAYVYENHNAWTQGNMNSVCLSLEQCTPSGAASGWSRDTWLSKTILIDNAAEWMNYIHNKYGIPYTWLSGSAATDTWSKGFCEHVNFGSYGSGHHDCGNGFPNDVVMNKAKSFGSGTAPAPSEGELLMASCLVIHDGKEYFAYINPQGKVCVNGGVVDPGSNAKSMGGIAINPKTGQKVVLFTNTGGHLCTYRQNDGDPKWYWDDKEISSK